MTSSKITLTGKYTTRDGRPVRVLCVDAKSTTHPVGALILCPDGGERSCFYTEKGTLNCGDFQSQSDLIPAMVKARLWVNVYADGWLSSKINHETEARAKESAGHGCLGTFPCTVELPADIAESAGLEIVTEEEGKS